MVKPVTQVNTQLVSSVSRELSESGVNQASQVIEHITGKQRVLRKDVYIFFFFLFWTKLFDFPMLLCAKQND